MHTRVITEKLTIPISRDKLLEKNELANGEARALSDNLGIREWRLFPHSIRMLRETWQKYLSQNCRKSDINVLICTDLL